MSEDQTYWWCLNHDRVEDGSNACHWKDRLGPFDTREQAERALQTVEERNARFDAEDEKWNNG